MSTRDKMWYKYIYMYTGYYDLFQQLVKHSEAFFTSANFLWQDRFDMKNLHSIFCLNSFAVTNLPQIPIYTGKMYICHINFVDENLSV